MDTNLYALEQITASRLAEVRADGARAALAASLVARRRRDVLALAGLALVRLGRLLGRRAATRRRVMAS